MSFQNILQVEKPDFYIDFAFSTATNDARALKSKKFKLPRNEIIRKVELTRVGTVNRIITKQLSGILESFPNVNELNQFYYELVKTMLDVGQLKKSLAALGWVIQKLEEFTFKYVRLINNTPKPEKMMQFRREHYGRTSSLFKQTKNAFNFLHEARKVLRSFPTVKSMPTVAICGFPNIGKTTLLAKLTGSRPEIADYAFTTRKLNIGYSAIDKKKIQFIDTPGTLNRFDKMNYIEKQAYLAAKHCADVIIYIYDLSEPYSLAEQNLLLKKFREFNKPIILYLSKTDILPREVVNEFKAGNDLAIDVRELKVKILKIINK